MDKQNTDIRYFQGEGAVKKDTRYNVIFSDKGFPFLGINTIKAWLVKLEYLVPQLKHLLRNLQLLLAVDSFHSYCQLFKP